MVSPYILASRQAILWQSHAGVEQDEIPILSLESLDGTRKILLDGVSGWTHLPGSTGLEMPPVDVVRDSVPGVYGSVLREVRIEERPVFIPLDAASPDYTRITHQAMLNAIRDLVDPLKGEFRVVCGNRQLTVVYTEGLEGSFGKDEFGLYWRRLGLKAVACQPFAQALKESLVEFRMQIGGAPFLGTAGGTDAPWGTRQITSSSLISNNMRVVVDSEVPVYPIVELVGPMDSFDGTMNLETAGQPSQQWSVSIPAGVPAGSTMRLVTNPRARSIRLDGALAAGQVARGSTLRPFNPGVNLMDVSAPGGNVDTRVRIMWYPLYRSLW